MLINYIKTMGLNCDIDISRTIQAVREQRSGMVQTETQYRFIYKAVQQYVNTMSKRIQMDNDLRRTGRDYTNINRAADDVGVIANVGAAASMFPSMNSNTHATHAVTTHHAGETAASSEMGASFHSALSGSPPNPGLNSMPPCSSSPPVPPLSPSAHRNHPCPVHGSNAVRKSHGRHSDYCICGAASGCGSSNSTHQSTTAPVLSSTKHSTTGLLHRLTGGARSRARP
ncbi:unnamed protein product [Echinostoma caproni]|uniref:protein-tyrosine-phosphatase n=1 Tax=Echinostoma caproni TaxID=27848 RepID=A0A183B4Q3_9TREM|nr:unnamed protein product [Echinostoma caproni]